MPGWHAVLSPSASERWISCPASVRVAAKVPREPESSYAAEGTTAHALGELKVRHAIGKLSDDEYVTAHRQWAFVNQQFADGFHEMEEHTDAYVALVLERRELYPDTQVLVEQRVQTGVPSCSGTADIVLVSPTHVEIIDLKYGQGVPVQAEGNSQLRLYAVGALEGYGDVLGEPTEVYMTVFQPRIGDGHADTAMMTPEDLLAWRDSLLPVAKLALSENAPFGPSEEACRWCPASGRCPAQLEHVTNRDFGTDVDLMSGEQIAEALAMVPQIREWLNALEVAALSMIYTEGEKVPGWKVVMSGGSRKVVDPEGAAKALREAGFTDEQFITPKFAGIGELEKLLRRRFDEVVGSYVTKSAGKPSLAPEDDKRPAANPHSEAVKEFGQEDVL